MNATIGARIRPTAGLLALLTLLAFMPAGGRAQNQPQNEPASNQQNRSNVVYVCACLGSKSCGCMTEAKTEGPCSCGTKGGPPMKAVPKDSAWAKANRKALAK